MASKAGARIKITLRCSENNTGIVILCVIVVGIFIWLFDAVAGALIEFLLGLFR